MIAFCAADLSDSTAAASASPVWPSPTCRVAMSSQGQRTASCSWGPPLMLPAAAARSGHTYRSERVLALPAASNSGCRACSAGSWGARKWGERGSGTGHCQRCSLRGPPASRHHRFSSLVPRAQRPLGAEKHTLNQKKKKKTQTKNQPLKLRVPPLEDRSRKISKRERAGRKHGFSSDTEESPAALRTRQVRREEAQGGSSMDATSWCLLPKN